MWRIGQQLDTRIEQQRRTQLSWQRHYISTLNIATSHTGQIDGYPATRLRKLNLLPMCLQVTDARLDTTGQQFDLLPHLKGAVQQRAGHNGAEAGHSKNTI